MTEELAKPQTAENPAPLETGEPRKKWAVLVFLGGENNLEDEMVLAIKAMKSSVTPPVVTSPPEPGRGFAPDCAPLEPLEFNFNALVQLSAEDPSFPTSALRVPRRFQLRPGDCDGQLQDDAIPPPIGNPSPHKPYTVEDYKNELIDFLIWGIRNAHASHLLVVFSAHGLGVKSQFLLRNSTPPLSLTVKDFARVLRDPRVGEALEYHHATIQILGLDSCLMSMAEIGYELRNEVRILVASQGSEANLGWPYRSIFKYLHDNRNAKTEELAQHIVDAFVRYYDDFAIASDLSSDLSACRLRHRGRDYMHRLKTEVDALAAALSELIRCRMRRDENDEATPPWDPAADEFARVLIFAHWYSQTYHFDQYVDLQDLCELLRENLPCDSEYDYLRESCCHVIEAVKNCTIDPLSRNFTGPLYQYSYGVSIYLPWSRVYKLYDHPDEGEQLDFLRGGKWVGFIHDCIEFTRRPPRPKPAEDWKKAGEKDSPPHSRGADDPGLRAKNPPSTWPVPSYVVIN